MDGWTIHISIVVDVGSIHYSKCGRAHPLSDRIAATKQKCPSFILLVLYFNNYSVLLFLYYSHITQTAQYRHPNAPRVLRYEPTPPLPRQLPIPPQTEGQPGSPHEINYAGYPQTSVWVPPNPYLYTGKNDTSK